MKKILITFGILLVCALGLNAAAPSAISSYGVPENGGILPGGYVDIADTVGGTNSVTLFSNLKFPNFWNYILVPSKITGAGNDSVKLHIIVEALDKDGNLLTRTIVDSLTDSICSEIYLPINETIHGAKFSIKAKGITGNGGVVILNKFYIYLRRAVIIDKKY
jgi:hypothetical protein